jgi:hypothetical protein
MSNEQTINSDFAIVIAAKYRSARNITELQALLVMAQQLEISLKELSPTLSNRARIKTIKLHIREISKRMTNVEQMNNKKNSERSKLVKQGEFMNSLVQSGLIPQLVSESRSARSEALHDSKQAAQIVRTASVPAIKAQFAEVGYDPTASKEDREIWENKQLKLKEGLPDTDLSGQGDFMLRRMQQAEDERSIEKRELGNTGLTTLEDGTDKLGSVEDWLK